jgi:hypothetical protein
MKKSLRTVKKTTKTVNPRSLENLRPFQKGQSGNPGGRPKLLITDAYQQQLTQIKKGRSYAELIADAQIKKAMKGDTAAAKEIADRTEGKARQQSELATWLSAENVEFNLNVHFVDGVNQRRRGTQ